MHRAAGSADRVPRAAARPGLPAGTQGPLTAPVDCNPADAPAMSLVRPADDLRLPRDTPAPGAAGARRKRYTSCRASRCRRRAADRPCRAKPSLELRDAPSADDPFEKLFGKARAGAALAYAPADGGVFSDGASKSSGKLPPNDGLTAIYDIKARTVYLPDGTKLEAHSGLGPRWTIRAT